MEKKSHKIKGKMKEEIDRNLYNFICFNYLA